MKRTTIFLSLLLGILVSTLVGQELEVNYIKVDVENTSATIRRSKIVNPVGGILTEIESVGEESKVTKSEAYLLEVISDSTAIDIDAENRDRSRVEVTKIEGTDYWLIGKSTGRVWIRVDAIFFKDERLSRKVEKLVVPALNNPDPTPDDDSDDSDDDSDVPDPEPDDDGPLPPDPNVDNAYNVGKISAQYAPSDIPTKKLVSKQFSDAGLFLYGIPSLKAVSSVNKDDPETNVFAWLIQQGEAMDCPNPEVCAKWSLWRSEVFKALDAEQKRRQMTRSDWNLAFREISNSLGVKWTEKN